MLCSESNSMPDKSGSTPLVSVILPSYNYARYLPERIESILSQSMQDFELILLDDASTDGSADILRSYADCDKVTALNINSANSGSPFSQWLQGISLARGKYIWIAEADDLATPDFLEKSVAVMERHPECVLAFSGSVCIDSEGRHIGIDHDRWEEKRKPPKPDSFSIFSGHDYIRRNLYWRSYIYNASGVIFRRDVLSGARREQAGKSASMRNSGDWLFWTVVASAGHVAEIYSKTNRFRIHQSSTTSQGNASGRRLREDIAVVHFIEQNYRISPLRRLIRHGALEKCIRRLKVTVSEKSTINLLLRHTFGHSPFAYPAERICKTLASCLPAIPSERSDRL